MNKVKLALALSISAILMLSFSSEQPAGRTGAPGDRLCSGCHANNGNFSGTLDISGLPSNPDPNVTYDITVTVNVTSGSPVRSGFSIVALDDTNDAQAGDWDNAGSSSSLRTSGGREYFGHDPAQSFGGGSSVSWDAEWTAPNITDDVTFYVAAILGNGSGSSGDKEITLQETVSITAMPDLEIFIGDFSDLLCNGDEDGLAVSDAMGGTPPYEYEWDNGETTRIAEMLDGGLHTVTVTDNAGNMATARVDIFEPDPLAIDEEIENALCFESADGFIDLSNISGGTTPYDFEWSNGDDELFISNLTADTYDVTITDRNECEYFFSYEITEPSELKVTLSSTDASSPGATDGTASAEASGGTPGYEYNWSNGRSGSTITDLIAGIYMVTVTDVNNCELIDMVTVSGGPCILQAAVAVDNISCNGLNDGRLSVSTMGATGNIRYQWSNGFSTSSIDNLSPGNYGVTIDDEIGCTVRFDTIFSISDPAQLLYTQVSNTDNNCAGNQEAMISGVITGGVGNYSMSWNSGQINDTTIVGTDTIINLPDTLINLGSGTYSYTVTDGNGCQTDSMFNIQTLDNIPPTLVLQQFIVELDEMGNSSPILPVDIDGGSSDNCGTYFISFPPQQYDCDDIGIQSFEVLIMDGQMNEATGTATVQVIESIPPVINCSNSSISSNSCNSVTYTIPTASDNCDIPELSLVSGLASGSIFPVGTNEVVYQATDACGNSSTCSFNVTIISDLEVTIDVEDALCDDNTGTLTTTVTGGTPPYTVAPFGPSQTGLAPGRYSITVTDDNNCEVIETVEIQDLSGPTLSVGDISICESETLFLDNITSSITIVQIIIDGVPMNIDPNEPFVFDLASGEYEVILVDSNGCESEPFTISVFFGGIVRVEYQLNCAGDVVTDQELIDDNPESTYIDLPSELGAGVYLIDAVDNDNGCSLQVEITVLTPDPITISNVMITDPIEVGEATGSITLDLIGGTMPYIIEWRDESGNVIGTQTNIDSLSASQTVELIVTDFNGCQEMNTFMIGGPVSVIDDQVENQILLYPNPVKDQLHLEFTNELPSQIEIFDTKGKLRFETKDAVSNYTLDTYDLAPGMYFLRVTIGKQAITHKFIRS